MHTRTGFTAVEVLLVTVVTAILLVAGDLSMQAGFEFYGPVIVRAPLITQSTGGHSDGGLIAANVYFDSRTVPGNTIVNSSNRAVTRVILDNASLTRAPRPTHRCRVDLTNPPNRRNPARRSAGFRRVVAVFPSLCHQMFTETRGSGVAEIILDIAELSLLI